MLLCPAYVIQNNRNLSSNKHFKNEWTFFLKNHNLDLLLKKWQILKCEEKTYPYFCFFIILIFTIILIIIIIFIVWKIKTIMMRSSKKTFLFLFHEDIVHIFSIYLCIINQSTFEISCISWNKLTYICHDLFILNKRCCAIKYFCCVMSLQRNLKFKI